MPLSLTLFFFVVPIYVYIGYPILLFILQLFVNKKHLIDEQYRPKVTLIVSCFNEEDVLEEKINNCLAIDYDKQLLDILFVSDGSTDRTDELVKQLANEQIKLIRQESRLGKTSALNMAVPLAKGEIIVFSDANAMYLPDAIKKLVRHFADPTIGLVVGASIYTDGNETSASKSEHNYWKYELCIKHWESKIHSVVGGDGAIYSIRKNLYQPLDAKDINDFVNPLEIIAKGFRGIFDREAICLEETAGNFDKEISRKERIVNRSFRGLMKIKHVMNPFLTGFFSIEVISHKLLRWFIPVFLLCIAIASTIHSYEGSATFQALYIIEMLFLWLAVIGYLKHQKVIISPLFFYPYYFLIVNYYSLIGILKALSGNIQVTWNSPRQKLTDLGISAKGRIISIVLFILPLLIMFDFLSLLAPIASYL